MRYVLVVMGVLTSASAQIMLKRATQFEILTKAWFLYIFLSVFLYFISFALYFYILRVFPISKIYPVMTICVIILITSYGFFIGEHIPIKQMVGLVLGMCSIYLILT
jgi:drug/metabolite transporter (DMT)-like permease